MPELPEVETVVCEIRPLVVGRSITGIRVQWPRTIGGLTVATYRRRVRGCVVQAVRRRGKYFLFDLHREHADAGTLVGHLRMSGRLATRAHAAPAPVHARVSYQLSDGQTLDFIDTRKFGRVEWVADPAVRLAQLGPEPFDSMFTLGWFSDALRRRRRQIKPLLLDQSFLAGLGNIYVDEALFRARIHPTQRSPQIGPQPRKRLYGAIVDVLTEAIAKQGSSFDQFYRTPTGGAGAFQNEFRVYGRAGEPCPRCRGRIRRIVVAQRGTHLCPRCQRKPRSKGST